MDRYVLSAGPPSPPTTVYLVRHGQSTYNAQTHRPLPSNAPVYVDAPLTQLGEAQALELTSVLPGLRAGLLVSSPLTRATQTMLLATSADPDPAPCVVTPLCTERVAAACDIGSPVEVLRARCPRLDYAEVGAGGWWWGGGTAEEGLRRLAEGKGEPRTVFKERVAAFRKWLVRREERCVVVFGHGVFLRSLAGGAAFANCEVRKIVL